MEVDRKNSLESLKVSSSSSFFDRMRPGDPEIRREQHRKTGVQGDRWNCVHELQTTSVGASHQQKGQSSGTIAGSDWEAATPDQQVVI